MADLHTAATPTFCTHCKTPAHPTEAHSDPDTALEHADEFLRTLGGPRVYGARTWIAVARQIVREKLEDAAFPLIVEAGRAKQAEIDQLHQRIADLEDEVARLSSFVDEVNAPAIEALKSVYVEGDGVEARAWKCPPLPVGEDSETGGRPSDAVDHPVAPRAAETGDEPGRAGGESPAAVASGLGSSTDPVAPPPSGIGLHRTTDALLDRIAEWLALNQGADLPDEVRILGSFWASAGYPNATMPVAACSVCRRAFPKRTMRDNGDGVWFCQRTCFDPFGPTPPRESMDLDLVEPAVLSAVHARIDALVEAVEALAAGVGTTSDEAAARHSTRRREALASARRT